MEYTPGNIFSDEFKHFLHDADSEKHAKLSGRNK